MPDVRVKFIGDTNSLQRAYRAAAEATKNFGKHATESANKTKGLEKSLTSSTHSMTSFAKSALYAGGALVGIGSVYEGLKVTISAAEQFNVAQRQLQAQLKANGESFAAVKPWVDKLRIGQEQLGFNMTQTADAFTKLDRASGSAAVAYKYMSTAADLARTRNIDLGYAAQLVGKIIQGNTSALNRFGIILPKNISETEALALVNKRLAGQAAAAVTPFNKFGAVLHDIEIEIGNVLLPVITRYLDKVTVWMSQAQHQRQITNDVKTALHDLGVAFNTAKGIEQDMIPIVKKASDAFKTFADGVGGTKHAVEILGAAFVTWKIASTIAGIGGAAGTATGEIRLLRLALLALAGNPAITIPIVLGIGAVVYRKQIEAAISGAVQAVTTAGAGQITGNVPFSKDPGDTRPDTSGHFPGIHFNIPGGPGGAALAPSVSLPSNVSGGRGKGLAGTGPPGPKTGPLTSAQLLQLGLAAHPNNMALLQQQAQQDRAAIAGAKKLRDQGKITNAMYVTEVLGYTNGLTSTLATISSVTSAAASKAAASRRKAAAAAKKVADAAAREYAQTITTSVARFKDALKKARAAAPKKELLDKTSPLRDAYEQLIAEAEKEAKDPKLSQSIRTRYRSLAATETAQLTAAIIAERQTVRRNAAAAVRKAASQLRHDVLSSVSGEGPTKQVSIQGQQFQALGLGKMGTGQSPLAESLTHELGRVKKALTGTMLDTNKNTHLLTQVGKVLEGQFGTLTDRTRAAIRKLLDTLSGELKKGQSGFGPTGRVVSAEALTAGLGLTGAARKTAEARIAQAIAHGGMVPAATVQGVPTVIHTHVHLDGRQIAHSVTSHQEKLGRLEAPQRRGMNAGRGHYLP